MELHAQIRVRGNDHLISIRGVSVETAAIFKARLALLDPDIIWLDQEPQSEMGSHG